MIRIKYYSGYGLLRTEASLSLFIDLFNISNISFGYDSLDPRSLWWADSTISWVLGLYLNLVFIYFAYAGFIQYIVNFGVVGASAVLQKIGIASP